MQEPADDILVHAAVRGDESAFGTLVTRHKRRVFGLAARFARDNDELEDMCQDVFIKAFENLKGYRGDAPFEHWLTRIAVNVCHDTLRRRRRESGNACYDDMIGGIADSADMARQATRQARMVLHGAMLRLSPDEQLIITLLELEEYTVREVAELTGWSEGNVKVRGHRARQALKRILEANDAR